MGILSLVHLLVVNVHLSADPATETGGVSPSRMELMRINDTFHRLRNELKRLDAQVAAAAIKPETSITVRKVSIESTEKGVKVPSRDSSKRNSAIIFTMDCIQSYEDQSKRGGAAGMFLLDCVA